MEFYTNEEIEEIIKRSAKILGVPVEKEASEEIAMRSRFTPRTANYLLKRARDFAQVNKEDLSKETVQKSLALLGIDELGLGHSDRALLKTLIEKFGGGPVGLNTLSAALSEEQSTIEDVHEPYLLQLGLIERTSRGRTATTKAFEHLKIKSKLASQDKLL